MNEPKEHANRIQLNGNIDSVHGEEVMKLLARKNENGIAIITLTFACLYEIRRSDCPFVRQAYRDREYEG